MHDENMEIYEKQSSPIKLTLTTRTGSLVVLARRVYFFPPLERANVNENDGLL